MNHSKIKDYLSAKTVFPIKRLWIPIFFTVVFSFILINDYLEALFGYLELASITLFRLIYIISFWLMYFYDKEYLKINDYIKKNETYDQSLFDELQEQTFQKKIKEFGLYVSVLIVGLLLFEGFRFLADIVSMTSFVEFVIFFSFLIFSIIFLTLSILSSRRLLSFLKSITIEKPL